MSVICLFARVAAGAYTGFPWRRRRMFAFPARGARRSQADFGRYQCRGNAMNVRTDRVQGVTVTTDRRPVAMKFTDLPSRSWPHEAIAVVVDHVVWPVSYPDLRLPSYISHPLLKFVHGGEGTHVDHTGLGALQHFF